MTSTLARPLGRPEIARDLRELGLPTEETYLVHSSLRHVGTLADGPEHLHDKQRKLVASSAFNAAVKWIDRINKAYIERGLDPSRCWTPAVDGVPRSWRRPSPPETPRPPAPIARGPRT